MVYDQKEDVTGVRYAAGGRQHSSAPSYSPYVCQHWSDFFFQDPDSARGRATRSIYGLNTRVLAPAFVIWAFQLSPVLDLYPFDVIFLLRGLPTFAPNGSCKRGNPRYWGERWARKCDSEANNFISGPFRLPWTLCRPRRNIGSCSRYCSKTWGPVAPA